jgi:hypothetical protein
MPAPLLPAPSSSPCSLLFFTKPSLQFSHFTQVYPPLFGRPIAKAVCMIRLTRWSVA